MMMISNKRSISTERERDYYAYLYEGEILQDELELVHEEEYHAKEEDFDEYVYFNEEEDSGKEECKLGYKEDGDDNDDNEEYEE